MKTLRRAIVPSAWTHVAAHIFQESDGKLTFLTVEPYFLIIHGTEKSWGGFIKETKIVRCLKAYSLIREVDVIDHVRFL